MNFLLSLDIWRIIAGIALFLLGMKFLEEALNRLSGRSFKLFLRRNTSTKAKAIAAGTTVAAVLQSSSIVNFMVLAFVAAGVLKMQNALGIVIGANLGTTLSNWLVLYAGFKTNIESFAFPITGIFGILTVVIDKESRWYHWSRLLLGIGFLFIGLSFIKLGMSQMLSNVDLAYFNKYPPIAFLIIGLVITALLQSSSATLAIVLSAVQAGGISLFIASAIVLGSEVGTTLKFILLSINGPAIQKRVAIGNFIANIVTASVVFIFLLPLNRFITDVIGIHDILVALVFFQTLTNIIGIVLFYPLLNPFGKFLERLFRKKEQSKFQLPKPDGADTDLIEETVEKEALDFLQLVARFSLDAFDQKNIDSSSLALPAEFESRSLIKRYQYIKRIHGEINQYITALQTNLEKKDLSVRLSQLSSSCRNAMYAAKSLKDAEPDLQQLKNSSNDSKYGFYMQTRGLVGSFYRDVLQIVSSSGTPEAFEKLHKIYQFIQKSYSDSLKELYNESLRRQLSEVEFSTLINFNREVYTSLKSMMFSVSDYFLSAEESNQFDELPGFIR